MKKVLLSGILFIALIFASQTQAQVSVSLNIGSQPAWGPVGYNYVDYYYLPDIDMYYNVPNHQYIYLSGNRWLTTTNLPSRYANFDFYNAYKVVLPSGININSTWLRANAASYRTKYASYKGRTGQQQYIYRSSDQKYKNYYKGNSKTQPRPPQNVRPGNQGKSSSRPQPGRQQGR